LVASSAGGWDVVASHTYAKFGWYMVYVHASDESAFAATGEQVYVVKPSPKPAAVHGTQNFFLRSTLTSGPAEQNVYLSLAGPALPGDAPLMGDWDGDGVKTPGLKRGKTYYFRNSNTSGPADWTYDYGLPTDVPVVGDWDRDGRDTIGVYRAGVWLLHNHIYDGDTGNDQTVIFGGPTDVPVAGDWKGDGITRIGVYSKNVFKFYDQTTGRPLVNVFFGNQADTPVVGDWDGDGIETPGVVKGNVWSLRNSLTSGPADTVFTFDQPGSTPLVWH
jgi:hypothetical protein